MEQYARACAYIDLDALHHNLNAMKKHMSPDAKILGVIKTDAYGHGAIPIAWEMESLSFVHGFAVATIEEAMQLRNSNIKKPILILGYTFPYSYQTMVAHDICPTVFRLDMLQQLNETAKSLQKKVHVHIKVDTGMSRIGIRPDQTGIEFVKEALSLDHICVEGIFTHFAKADELDKTFADHQYQQFTAFVKECQETLQYQFPYVHCSNSAAIIDMPYANMDLVRAGIAIYGMWPSGEVDKSTVALKPVMSLKSHIIFVKEVEKGTPVSYNGTFITEKKTTIATIPVGYGDGYPRKLSNIGAVLINGKKAPILGRICMDQFMVDVTGIPCKEGDAVTLIGYDGDESLSMEYLGEISGRFNYELACDIGKRIPHVFLKNGKPIYSKDYNEDIKINHFS